MITVQTWKRGFVNGFGTSWMLLKIIIPVYAAVTVLGHTPVLAWVSEFFGPVMEYTGLPGGAAVAFVTGSLVNIYAAMGIILALNLNAWQMTIIAVMLNISHELLVESAILKKTGITVWPIFVLRLVGAFFVGVAMNLAAKLFM